MKLQVLRTEQEREREMLFGGKEDRNPEGREENLGKDI